MKLSMRNACLVCMAAAAMSACLQETPKNNGGRKTGDSMDASMDTHPQTGMTTGRPVHQEADDQEGAGSEPAGYDLRQSSSRPAAVLPILELYRAKRYESVNEALAATDTVYKLILYGQNLGKVPPEISELQYLNSLDLSYNGLREIPDDISDLRYLQGLYFKGNRIGCIPAFVYDCRYLYRLDLSGNSIDELSTNIYRLNKLSVLNLGSNSLTEIPSEMYDLGKLVALYLNDNRISEIPEGISGLSSLTRLFLQNNRLKNVPGDLKYMTQLKELWLQGNNIPMPVIEDLQLKLPGTKIRY